MAFSGRVEIKRHDLRRLWCELRVRTDAPAAAMLQLDPVLAEEVPDLVGGDLQGRCQDTAIPASVTIGWRLAELPQQALAPYSED